MLDSSALTALHPHHNNKGTSSSSAAASPAAGMLSPLQQMRHLEVEGTTNLRNLGGYRTTDGTKTTKWGVLYRGDCLDRIPSHLAQKVLVQGLHIHNAYDLRSRREVAQRAYHIPHINRFAVPIDTHMASQALKTQGWLTDAAAAVKGMCDVYREIVHTHGGAVGAVIRGFLRTQPSSDNAAVFHCTAGKDRTGWTAYVLLTLLDVAEEEKRVDYLLTNLYYECPKEIASYLRGSGMSRSVLSALWTAYEAFLDAAVAEVRLLGGMRAYAKSHMGLTDVDIQQLREVMLEDCAPVPQSHLLGTKAIVAPI